MARPKKNHAQKRTRVLRTRVTPEDELTVIRTARAYGLSPSEFQRRRCLGVRLPDMPASRTADPALIEAVNRLGVNVNQLAKATHMGRDFAGSWQSLAQDVDALLAKLVAGDVS